MLRFPNPGSTIENFVRIYTEVFNQLGRQVSTLDEVTRVVVAANLATSSGYVGKEAIARSTRPDRSRDPLYNQHKMYAELFRWLGFLHPIESSALRYTCTLLGGQIVKAGRDFIPLLDECVLGITCPNPIIKSKGDYHLRPFAFILRVMAACGGYISRDEMIVGPLSAASDHGQTNLASVVATIQVMRRNAASAANAMDAVSAARDIKINTLQNYTRWPIALLRDLGWATRESAKFSDGNQYAVFRLTNKGKALASRVANCFDLRSEMAAEFAPEERKALAVLTHFRMLERSGFDITQNEERITEAEAIVSPILRRLGTDQYHLLFSPFQSLSLADIANAFPEYGQTIQARESKNLLTDVKRPTGRSDRTHLFVQLSTVTKKETDPSGPTELRDELSELLSVHRKIEIAAEEFTEKHIRDTQTKFYPLIAQLFQILGFDSDYSRPGANYQRWDACVMANGYALPVEIKSPTEEISLSTKAVRQALENKVILLSRKTLKTHPHLTSLIVGYRLPNERGEMSNLIDDIFAAYSLRLGVIDLTTLAHLALRALHHKVTIDARQLSQLRGFLSV